MKKWCLFLSLYFCICLLAACAGGDVSAGAGADSGGTPAEETRTGGETTEPGRVTETFRLVTVGDGDDPASVLAGTDGGAGAVYTLDLFSVEDLTIEGYTQEEMDLLDWSPMPGALVEVTWDGSVMESYPMRFGTVASVRILEDGFDDLCRLHLDVLNDLWEVDPSLNDGITELGGGPVRDLPAGKRTGRGGLCLRLRPRADGYGGHISGLRGQRVYRRGSTVLEGRLPVLRQRDPG